MPPASRGLHTFRSAYFGSTYASALPVRPFPLRIRHFSPPRKLPPPLKEHQRSKPFELDASPLNQNQIPEAEPNTHFGSTLNTLEPLLLRPSFAKQSGLIARIRAFLARLRAPFRRVLQRRRAYWHPPCRFAIRLLPWLPPALLILLHAPVQLMWVQGASMSPYLNTHWSNDTANIEDRVLVAKYTEFTSAAKHANFLQPTGLQRGMIIVFNTPHNPERVAVKRIIGLPGDRVQPLPGYPGGNTSVIVPWNHLWVEGDAESREKSIDSNWYGPISKSLVVGRVTHVLGSWFWPGKVEWETHRYPAQTRVEKDAVQQIDPDMLAWKEATLSGMGDVVLQKMREQPEQMEKDIRTPQGRGMLKSLVARSRAEMSAVILTAMRWRVSWLQRHRAGSKGLNM